MGLWASSDDVFDRWPGSNPPTDDILVEQLVQDVEVLIQAEFPDIETRMEDEDQLLRRIRIVVAQVVIRLLRNPDGVREMHVGDAGTSYEANPAYLTLTSSELALLSVDGRALQRAFTIDPTPIVDEVTDLAGAWVNGPLGMEPTGW